RPGLLGQVPGHEQRRVRLTVDEGHDPAGTEGPVPERCGGHPRVAEYPVEPDECFPEQPAGEPEVAEADEKRDGGVEVVASQSPLQGAPEVVVLRYLSGGELVVGEEPDVRLR